MIRLFVIFLFIKVVQSYDKHTYSSDDKKVFKPKWTYDNEDAWPGAQCKAGGKKQSPIDINTEDVIMDGDRRFIKYGPLIFTGYTRVLMSGINNGHTVQFSSEGEEAIHPTLTGGPLMDKYRLEQIHFHWLSEHSINGVKYPMEIHFVHVRSDLTVKEALNSSDGLAIVAVFCNLQAALDDYEVQTFEVIQYLPKLLKMGDRVSGVLLNLTKLLSPNLETYYTYAGSLTSPECNEVVIWIIFDKPIYMSDAQYRKFGKIGIGRHNFRSLQKLKRHAVFAPGRPKIERPYLMELVQDVFSMVKRFIKQISPSRLVKKIGRPQGY